MKLQKTIIKKITYPLIARADGHAGLFTELVSLEESQYWDREKILEFQFKKLKKLLIHAYENTQFYKDRFNSCEFDPYKFQSPDELNIIPILTKKDIQEFSSQMKAVNLDENEMHMSTSGGTTGFMTEFYRDNACLTPKEASLLRFEQWAGWEFGEWMSLVWPATMDMHDKITWKMKLRNFLSAREIKLALTVIDHKRMAEHLKKIRKHRAKMIRGFAMPVTELAKYAIEHNITDLHLRGIITTGEPLYPAQRKIIEQAFHCPVFNSYRTREVGPIAQECDQQNGFHLNAENIYLETIPLNKQKVKNEDNPENLENIIVTDLLNYGMPFIRYEIGDLGRLSNKKCSCGRGLPLLEGVGGRLVDMVYTPDGRKIASVTLIPNLVHTLGLKNRIQLIQNDFDQLLIRMTLPVPPDDILQQQRENALKIFGPQLNISYEFVEQISPLKSGKYAFIICNIPKEKLIGI